VQQVLERLAVERQRPVGADERADALGRRRLGEHGAIAGRLDLATASAVTPASSAASSSSARSSVKRRPSASDTEAERTDGTRFRNTEIMAFAGSRRSRSSVGWNV
jgi:hypothetical protein